MPPKQTNPSPFEWLIGMGRLSHGSLEASAALHSSDPGIWPFEAIGYF